MEENQNELRTKFRFVREKNLTDGDLHKEVGMFSITEKSLTIGIGGGNFTYIPSLEVIQEDFVEKSRYTRDMLSKVDLYMVYTKEEIDSKLSLINGGEVPSLENYYTKNEIDNKLTNKADINLVYTKEEVNALLGGSSSVDVSIYYTKNEIDNKLNLKLDIDTFNIEKQNYILRNELNNYCLNSELETKLSDKLDISTYENDKLTFALKDNTYTKEEVDNKITQIATGGSVDLSNYATKQELDTKADVISLSSKLDTSVYESDKDSFATKDELNLKADESLMNEKISLIETSLNSKTDNSDYQITKNKVLDTEANITELNNKLGNLQSTGLTGSTVTELLTDVKTKIDENRNELINYYTKNEVYNKTEVDDLIGLIPTFNENDYYTKAESDGKYALSSDLSNKVDSSVIGDLQGTGLTGNTVTELLTDVKTKIDAIPSTGGTSQDTRIGELADLTTTEKSTIVGAINELAARPSSGTSTNVDLTDYYNKEEVEELIYNECDTQFNEAVFKYREKIDGLDDAIKNSSVGPVYRIPSLTISKNGTIHVVCDARDTGGDQGRLEISYARSVDGGKTWSKQIIGHRYKGSGYSEANSRVMDPTILDAGDGLIFVLAGRWITGTNNWTRNADSANNWSAALLMKSTDDGRTWSQHTIGKADCTSQEGTHITVDNLRSGCKGFLGGINPGFRHSSGKLVFQIQFTTGSGDAKSTLLTSDDNGVSWRMAGGDTGGTNYECSMIELPDGRIVLHTRSEDSDAVVNSKSMKKAFVTDDFGETWSVYSPLNKKVGSKTSSGGGHRCEGGTMGATTISGTYICAAAYPQVTADSELGHTSDWARNQITLYACNLTNETVIPIQMIQYRSGLTPTTSGNGSTSGTPFGGYSSLIYKQTDDGEYFVTVFEDELGISTRNLSHLLPRLELYSGVNATLSQSELINVKTQVMADVNTKISAWPNDFTSFIDTHTIPENKTFNVIGSDLNTIGSITVGGGFLNSDGNIDNTKLSLSPLAPGLLHIVCTDTSDGSVIRGNVSIDSSATVLSIAMTFCQPTTSSTVDDYQPLVRFFDNATAVAPGNNKGGLEIKADGTLYVTKCSGSSAVLEKDRIYNIVVEYDSAGAKVYLDGVLVNTQSGTSLLSYIKSASYMCIGAQGNGGGSSSVKRVDMHIGNIAIYSRQLTDNEKKNVRWINGIDNKTNTFDRFYNISEQLNYVTQSVDSRATLSDIIELIESNNWIQSHPNEKLLPKMKNLIFNLDNNTFTSTGSVPGELMVSSSSKLRKAGVEQSNFNTDVTSTASSSNWGYMDTNVMYIGREVEDLNITVPSDKNVSCANGFSIWISATPKENFVNRSWSDLFYISSRSTFSGGNNDHRANDNNLFRIEAGNTSDSNNRATINIYGNTTLTTEKYFIFNTKTNILVTVKDSKVTLYIDGEKIGSSSLSTTSLIPTYIGLTKANNNTLANKFPNVEINSISMWNVALRDDEVEAVFKSRQ